MTLPLNQKNMFTEIALEQAVSITGGSSVNFDPSTYSFGLGAGAIFNGGLTTNVRDNAFQGALQTSSAPVSYNVYYNGTLVNTLTPSFYNILGSTLTSGGATITPNF